MTTTYTPRLEQRSIAADARSLILTIVAIDTTAALEVGVESAVDRFRRRLPRARMKGKQEE